MKNSSRPIYRKKGHFFVELINSSNSSCNGRCWDGWGWLSFFVGYHHFVHCKQLYFTACAVQCCTVLYTVLPSALQCFVLYITSSWLVSIPVPYSTTQRLVIRLQANTWKNNKQNAIFKIQKCQTECIKRFLDFCTVIQPNLSGS